MNNKTVLSLRQLTKTYGHVTVLDHVSIDFQEGEIHALLGENGAGKSTLCKMIAGAITPTEGEIVMDGKTIHRFTPIEAKAAGIGMVYQELNLIPEMTVYENLFVGKEIRTGCFVNSKEMIRRSQEIFDDMGIKIDCTKKVKQLSVAYCQLIEIAKALLENSRVLILDEPTAPLTNNEVDILFRVLEKLRKHGIVMIYISHRLEEVFRLCDTITVLRDGHWIRTMSVSETNNQELIHLMTGRELSRGFPEREADFDYSSAQPVLRVEDLCGNGMEHVSFELNKGEILGIAGLVGAGRTETVRAIFGADRVASGSIYINGKPVKIRSPRDAIRNSVALIPEDRKLQGLMGTLPIGMNISIIVIKALSKLSFVQRKKERKLLDEEVQLLNIKASSLSHAAFSLSGGNQQKIVLAKWLSTNSDILMFDEPTRGIDVGAKREIYDFLFALKKQGKSIIIISSELGEILNLSDRILVMHEGTLQGELLYQDATQDKILTMASGLA